MFSCLTIDFKYPRMALPAGIFAFTPYQKGFSMPTLMPTDDNNNPIPALKLKDGGSHVIAATATSARNSTPFPAGTQIVSVYTTVPIFIKFGVGTITATPSDHYFPAGLYYDFAIGGDGQSQATHIAVLRADTTDGTTYISEKV